MAWQWQGYAAGSSHVSDYMVSSSSVTYKKTQTSQPPRNREQHMKKLESWLCKICNKTFPSKQGLNCHFTTVHEQPKQKAIKDAPRAMVPYRPNTGRIVCNICGNDFVSQSNLTRHISMVHNKAAHTVTKNKVVQKNTTNVTINIYKPTYNVYNNRF